jgi:hypothetical protein
MKHVGEVRTPEAVRVGLEAEMDKFTIWPDQARQQAA